MSSNVAYTEADVCNFVEALSQLPDNRDTRGKRHALACVGASSGLSDLKWALESLKHLSLYP